MSSKQHLLYVFSHSQDGAFSCIFSALWSAWYTWALAKMLTNSSAAWQLNLCQHFLKVLYFNVLLHIQSLLSLFYKNIRTNSEMFAQERRGQKSELLRKILLTKGKLCWTVLKVQNKWSPLENRTTELFNIMWPEQQAMKIWEGSAYTWAIQNRQCQRIWTFHILNIS